MIAVVSAFGYGNGNYLRVDSVHKDIKSAYSRIMKAGGKSLMAVADYDAEVGGYAYEDYLTRLLATDPDRFIFGA